MSKGFSWVPLIIVGLFVVSIVVGGAYLMRKNTAEDQNITLPITSASQVPTLLPTPSQVANYPGTREFVSSALKIAFNYAAEFGGQKFSIKEVGNKVYVYADNTPAENGQFVEVFPKSSQESIEQAVKKQFLAGKSEKDCFVVTSAQVFKNYPASYKAVEISFPKPTDESDAPWFTLSEKCSADYAQTNGIRFFLGDTQHPTTLLFISIGQYGIPATQNVNWQDTIRFLN